MRVRRRPRSCFGRRAFSARGAASAVRMRWNAERAAPHGRDAPLRDRRGGGACALRLGEGRARRRPPVRRSRSARASRASGVRKTMRVALGRRRAGHAARERAGIRASRFVSPRKIRRSGNARRAGRLFRDDRSRDRRCGLARARSRLRRGVGCGRDPRRRRHERVTRVSARGAQNEAENGVAQGVCRDPAARLRPRRGRSTKGKRAVTPRRWRRCSTPLRCRATCAMRRRALRRSGIRRRRRFVFTVI